MLHRERYVIIIKTLENNVFHDVSTIANQEIYRTDFCWFFVLETCGNFLNICLVLLVNMKIFKLLWGPLTLELRNLTKFTGLFVKDRGWEWAGVGWAAVGVGRGWGGQGWGGQRVALGIFLCYSLISWDQASHWVSFTNSIRLVVQEAPGIFLSLSQCWANRHAPLSEYLILALCLCHKHFTNWSHLSSPQSIDLKHRMKSLL